MSKVWLVTGATSGIGRELARQIAAKGDRVAALARRAERLAALEDELGADRFLPIHGDVAAEEDCRRLVEAALARWSRVDVAVANAGTSMNAPFLDTSTEVFRKMMEVNYFGSLHLARASFAPLRASGGSFLFVSSIVGKRGFPTRSGYSASKFAVQGLFESLRAEWKDTGVHVGCLSPGYTDTEIRERALGADGCERGESSRTVGSVMSADVAARAVVRAVEKRRREIVLTPGGRAMVWINRLFPAWADRLAARVMR